MKNLAFTIVFFSFLISCNSQIKEVNSSITPNSNKGKVTFLKLSIAQWSLHNSIWDKSISPYNFAKEAKEMGFEGLEYVSTFYNDLIKENGMSFVLDSLNYESKKYGLKNLLIMVDGEGELANPDKSIRDEAVVNHKKWVDAAAFLNCHSIRVNLFGTRDSNLWKEASIDGLSKLSKYAKSKNINIIVENHGYLSSDAGLLVDVIRSINMPNCGILPDFGNFCLEREGGEQWNGACIKEYDKYKGVEEMMPFAMAVSAKSYDFDDKTGEETKIDYKKMLQIIMKSGFKGYIGVEYEGSRLSEKEGILATKELLLRYNR